MSSKFRQVLWAVACVAFVAMIMGGLIAEKAAAAKRYAVQGLATSIAPAVIDTSSVVNVSVCGKLQVFIGCDGDSALVTMQGSQNGSTNFYTVTTFQLNGTDETFAMQASKPLSVLGTGGTTYVEEIPPRFIRFIVNNNDAAGADTLESFYIDMACTD